MYQLKSRQICLFFIAFVPVTKLFVLPSVIAGISGSDMWISVFIGGIIDLATILSLSFACKKNKTDILTLMETVFGKPFTKAILSVYAILFFLKAILPIYNLKNYVEIKLYETTPSFIYFLPFFILCFYFCSKPIRVLGRCSDVMWIMTAIGMVLFFSLSVSNVDLSNILPIGIKFFLGQ